MHIGTDGTYKDSKTEAVFFPPPGIDPNTVDTPPVQVANGYITYTPSFKYLGSYITQDLSDTFDVKNRIIQANKAMASMMPHVFQNKSLSQHVNKLLYMAIPMNLLLWGCETWALKESDRRLLQVFHTTSIRRILNINMLEVQMRKITNEFLYEEFRIDPIAHIMASRQVRWLGNIARMGENRLPRKFIAAWHTNPRPMGRPQQTLRHTYLHALRMLGAIPQDDKEGKLETWFPQAIDDPKDWERRRRALTPNLIGRKDKEIVPECM